MWILSHPLLGLLLIEFLSLFVRLCLEVYSKKCSRYCLNEQGWMHSRIRQKADQSNSATSPPHSLAGSQCPLSAAMCLSLTAPYFSSTGISPLHCRVTEQRDGMRTAFIYFQFLSPFITLTVPVIHPLRRMSEYSIKLD